MNANFNDIMDDEQSFKDIIGGQVQGTDGFCPSVRGVTVLTDDYETARDLMNSDEKQIKR